MSVTAMETRLKGKHILTILLSFFAIVAIVNAAFIYFALSTRPGEEKNATYEIGLRYNNVLEEQRTQDALRWHHRSQIAEETRLRLAITDASGAPVPGLALTGSIGRPASDGADRNLDFKEADTGVYEADLGALDKGSWVLLFTAQKVRAGAEPAVYRVKERLWLSPAH